VDDESRASNSAFHRLEIIQVSLNKLNSLELLAKRLPEGFDFVSGIQTTNCTSDLPASVLKKRDAHLRAEET